MIRGTVGATWQYFNQVIEEFKRNHFAFMAKTQIGTRDLPYHVPCIMARVTSLFFHLPGFSYIVQMELHEGLGVDGIDGYRQHWRVDIYALQSQMRWEELARRKYREWKEESGRDSWGLDDFDWHAYGLCALTGAEDIDGIREGQIGCFDGQIHRSYDMERGRTLLTPTAVVAPIAAITNRARQVVDSNRFPDLQVTGFPPEGVFPGCGPLFWSRFPMRRLREKVRGRIWGSDFA